MYNHLLYLFYWLINLVVIYLVKWLWPESLILGNWRFAEIESAIYTGFWMTFLLWLVWDFALARGLRMEDRLATWLFFGVVNCASVWVITRFGFYLGLAVSSFSWVLVVGLAATLIQRLIWSLVVERKKRTLGV